MPARNARTCKLLDAVAVIPTHPPDLAALVRLVPCELAKLRRGAQWATTMHRRRGSTRDRCQRYNDPAIRRDSVFNVRTGVRARSFKPIDITKKPAQGGHFCLVEAGGIEPPSEGAPRPALHA